MDAKGDTDKEIKKLAILGFAIVVIGLLLKDMEKFVGKVPIPSLGSHPYFHQPLESSGPKQYPQRLGELKGQPSSFAQQFYASPRLPYYPVPGTMCQGHDCGAMGVCQGGSCQTKPYNKTAFNVPIA